MPDTEPHEEEIWSTSVSALMGIFRECLIAIQPPLERARIWPACYDDWDAIVEAIWKNVVVRTIEFAIPEDLKEEPKLEEGYLSVPKFGFIYGDYSRMSFIEVVHSSLKKGSVNVFRAFNYLDVPLCTKVTCCRLDSGGKVVEEERVPATDATYRFQMRNKTGELRPLDALFVRM